MLTALTRFWSFRRQRTEGLVMDGAAKVVDSSLSQAVYVDGFVFDVFIYRLDGDATWTLEVVDEVGGAHIWTTDFASDLDALAAAQTAIRKVGPVAFMSDDGEPTAS
ncbi:hypothetical protein [Roseivivax sediminis]|nr:hypothetical protein [Roseivivax sediminis]